MAIAIDSGKGNDGRREAGKHVRAHAAADSLAQDGDRLGVKSSANVGRCPICRTALSFPWKLRTPVRLRECGPTPTGLTSLSST